MRPATRVVLGFMLVGLSAIAASAFSVGRISRRVVSIQEQHSPSLQSILTVKAMIADGVQESLAYFVSKAPADKEDCLRSFEKLGHELRSFAEVARIDSPTEEQERELFVRIVALQAEIEKQARAIFVEVETMGSPQEEAISRYESLIDSIFTTTSQLVLLEHSEVVDLQATTLEAVSQTKLSLWGVAASVLVFAFAVALATRRMLNQHDAAKVQQDRDRDDFVKRILSVQDDERRRVARDLHDETGQALTALSVGLRDISEAQSLPSAQDAATRLLVTAESLIRELGRLVQGLHPQIVEDLGLIAAITQVTVEFRRVHGLDINLETAGVDQRPELPDGAALSIFRIVQEALSNVARHAQANHVEVLLSQRENHFRIMVEDDGCGFNVNSAKRGGIGLQSMRERATALGSKLVVESDDGHGTTIAVDVEYS